jgi:serine/threonine protein kinase
LILSGKISFNDEVWQNISDDAKDLIMKLLTPPEQRITIDEALSHNWLKEDSDNAMSKIST